MKKFLPSYKEFKENTEAYNQCESIDASLELRYPKYRKVNYVNFVIYYFRYSKFIRKILCKIFGHKIEMESGGNAESGPITDWYCLRCGIGGREWGM